MFIDKVKSDADKDLLPPPPTYKLPEGWGKRGKKISFASRIHYESRKLDEKGFLPGPGQYIQPEGKLVD